MKIKESQLRNIIENALFEAISQQDANLAQKFIKQAGNGGYTTSQAMPSNLFQSARKALGARSDERGQYDMLRSANDIYPLIQRYNAEIAKLQRVYNYISKRANGDYTAPKRSGNHLSAASLQKRRDNMQRRQAIRTSYGDVDTPSYTTNSFGAADTSKLGVAGNMRKTSSNIAAQGNQGWLGSLRESVNEFLNRSNQPDEVDNIVANYRNYANPQYAQEALQKIGARLKEYQTTVQQLQALLNQWQQSGQLVDTNAELRAQRDDELKGVGRRSRRAVAESIENIVDGVIKKYLG